MVVGIAPISASRKLISIGTKINFIAKGVEKYNESICVLKRSRSFKKLMNYSTQPHSNSLPEARLIAADPYLSSQDEEREGSGASSKGEGQALIGLKWGCLGGIDSLISFHQPLRGQNEFYSILRNRFPRPVSRNGLKFEWYTNGILDFTNGILNGILMLKLDC